MSPEKDDELCRKYPMLYAQRHWDMRSTCMCWGFETGDGWYSLIDRLSAKLEAINERLPPKDGGKGCFKVEAGQVKSKYACLCFYASIPAEVSDEVNRLINEASMESSVTCEDCGAPGVVISVNGWYTCLCPEHAPKVTPHRAEDERA